MVSSRTNRYHLRTINKTKADVDRLERIQKNLIYQIKMGTDYNNYYVHSYNNIHEYYTCLLDKHHRLWDINDDLTYTLETVEAENKELKKLKERNVIHNPMH